MKKYIVLIITLTVLFSVPTFAAQYVELSSGTTYSNLDFNGDGSADNFYYTYDREDDGQITLHMNGCTQKVFVARGTSITYYKLSDSQIFLFIYAHQFGGGTMLTYRYVGNSIQKVNSDEDELNVMPRTLFHHISGEYVFLEDSPYHQSQITSFKNLELPGYDLTTFLFKYKYDPSKGKFVRASRYAKTEKSYKMTYKGKAFKTSTSATKINKKGVTLKPGAKVRLVQIYIIPQTITSNGNTYTIYKFRFKVKYKGKYGWFTNGNNRPFA